MPIATDIKSFLTSPASTVNHLKADSRDRPASLSTGSSDNRFDDLLGTTLAHRASSNPAPMVVRSSKPMRSAPLSHPRPTSQADRSAPTKEGAREERPVAQTETKHAQNVERLDDGEDEQKSETHDESVPSDNVTPGILLAGAIPQPSTDGQHESSQASSVDTVQAISVVADGVQSATAAKDSALTRQSMQTVSQSAALGDSQPALGQTPAGVGSKEAKPTGGETNASVGPVGKIETPGAVLLPDDKNPEASSEKASVLFDGHPTDAHAESNKTNSTAAVTSSDMLAKSPANADPINQSDLQSPFRAVAQASDMSAGHDTSGTEQFLNQEHTSSESRNGSDHAKLNLLPSDDVSLRPQFLDQTTGVSPSAPPAVESRIGRGEAGQTVVIHGSERIHDLPGGTASAQTVTLDLDPLDMGPLRVRIMMTEQIIHTHIRTEHGELGQGLLQHGPSLEASLRTTGFEMGTLRVTVDQQQQGRGEHPWAFQQQQGRAEFSAGQSAPVPEPERASRTGQNIDNNGRVSWVA